MDILFMIMSITLSYILVSWTFSACGFTRMPFWMRAIERFDLKYKFVWPVKTFIIGPRKYKLVWPIQER